MKIILRSYAILILLLFLKPSDAQDTSNTSVLFIGNSYTYFWNLPQSVNAFTKHENLNYTIKQSTAGGANLGEHWRGEKSLSSKDLIKNGQFDVVILQDHSTITIDHPDSLIYYGHKFAEIIKETNGKPYLYMTWSREWDPFMIDSIEYYYEKLGIEIGAEVVPVGLAWKKALHLRPDLPLYDEDMSHPSPLGTYLNACVFYSVLTGRSPIGLPNRLTTKDETGQTLFLNIQSKENALFCQKVAYEVTKLK